MNLSQIKAMFVAGDRWLGVNESPGMTIRGNVSTTVLPSERKESLRIVHAVHSKTVEFARPTLPAETPLAHLWTEWPKASEVIEARPGYLKFQYKDGGCVVTLTKLQ